MTKRCVVGYDLNEKNCQISYYNENMENRRRWKWHQIIIRFL